MSKSTTPDETDAADLESLLDNHQEDLERIAADPEHPTQNVAKALLKGGEERGLID